MRWERRTYLADLLYLLERTGAVGLREVLMSDILFAVGTLGARSIASATLASFIT